MLYQGDAKVAIYRESKLRDASRLIVRFPSEVTPMLRDVEFVKFSGSATEGIMLEAIPGNDGGIRMSYESKRTKRTVSFPSDMFEQLGVREGIVLSTYAMKFTLEGSMILLDPLPPEFRRGSDLPGREPVSQVRMRSGKRKTINVIRSTMRIRGDRQTPEEERAAWSIPADAIGFEVVLSLPEYEVKNAGRVRISVPSQFTNKSSKVLARKDSNGVIRLVPTDKGTPFSPDQGGKSEVRFLARPLGISTEREFEGHHARAWATPDGTIYISPPPATLAEDAKVEHESRSAARRMPPPSDYDDTLVDLPPRELPQGVALRTLETEEEREEVTTAETKSTANAVTDAMVSQALQILRAAKDERGEDLVLEVRDGYVVGQQKVVTYRPL